MTWVIALVVPLVFALLAALVPYKQNTFVSVKNFETLKTEYDKWEKLALVPFFLLTTLFGYLLGETFFFLFENLHTQPDDILIHIVPKKNSWYIPGGIISFSLIGYFMEFTYKTILRGRYNEYMHYTNLKHGFDGAKFMKPITWIIGLFGMIYIIGLSDFSISVYENKIVYNKMVGLANQNLENDQVKSIRHFEGKVFDNQFTEAPYYLIEFENGFSLNTSTDFPDQLKQDEVAQHLSSATNLIIKSRKYK